MNKNSLLINALQAAFEHAANKNNAIAMQAYMKNKFEFYGIKAPDRRAIYKNVISQIGMPSYEAYLELARTMFTHDKREMHLTAIDFAGYYKKNWDERIVDLHKYFAINNSWWDTVDTCSSIIGRKYFKNNPEAEKYWKIWNVSENMWLNRLSIIGQITFKLDTNQQILAENILNHTTSKEFFIQKAIGWALRDYGQYNPRWVIDFVAQHELKPLSKREALRKIVY